MLKQDPQNDQLAVMLAEIEETSAHGESVVAPDATTSNLKAELDTMAGNLRGGKKKDQFEDESDCGRVTELVQAIGQDADDMTIDSATGNTQPAEKSAQSALGNIGQYEIITKLGEGGMGAVYKARHTKLDKIVAIKVLPSERMKDKDAVARFEREMRAVGKLEHPNIVRAMDAGEVDDMHFLVMEYVKGRDLSQLVKQHGPLPIPEACELIRQAAVGLDEAFDNDMVHRDIKPSNLILAQRRRKPPVVKILDMGLALLSDAHSADAGLTTTGQMMGTLDYMAPEQGGDSKNVDIRADIYALGASLYRLLCGEVIYHGEKYSTPVQKMMALAVAPAPPIQDRRDGIPDELAAIVHRMLEKEPDNRYATPQEIADHLAPFCAGADLGWLLTGERSESTGPMDASLSATELGASSSEVDTSVTTAPSSEPSVAAPSAVTIAPAITTVGAAKTQTSALRKIPKNLLIAGGAGLLGIAALLAALVFFVQTPQGTLRVEINDPEIEVQVKGEDFLLTNADKQPIKLKAGEHSLIVTRGDFTFETKQLILKKGETTTVKVELVPGKVQVVSAGEVIGGKSLPGNVDTVSSVNYALACDQNIESPHHVKLSGLTLKELPDPRQVCIEGYVRLRDAQAENRDLFGFAYEFTTRLHDKDHWKATAYLTDSAAQPIAKVPVAFNEWVHVAAVRDEDELRLYVDGEKVASAKVEEDFDNRGRPFIMGANELHADFDELRVSSSARYDKDFKPPMRFTPDEHTLALYHCDEGSGDVLKDSSGNNHHGKIVGAKWVRVEPVSTADTGSALDFTGGGRVDLPALPLGGLNELCVEAWLTPRVVERGKEMGIFQFKGHANLKINQYEVWDFAVNDGKSSWHGQSVRQTAVADRLTHVAGTIGPDGLRLYVDGKLHSHKGVSNFRFSTKKIATVMGENWDGTIRQLRVSKTRRYGEEFTPAQRLASDEQTLALYHFDEGSGDVLKDSSGNNHHGKIVGAKWVKTGDAVSSASKLAAAEPGANNALHFDGENGQGAVVAFAKPWDPKEFTIEARVATEQSAGNYANIANAFPLARLLIFQGWAFSSNSKDDGLAMVRDDSKLPLGRNAHVAGVFKDGQTKLYVDGRLVAEAKTTAKMPAALRLHIGDRGFQGQVDEIRLSNSARYLKDFDPPTADQQFVDDDQTYALFHCDEGSGNVLKDSSGNNHHGKIAGAKWVKVDSQSSSNELASQSLALEFPGGGQRVELPPMTISCADTFCLEAWVQGTEGMKGSLLEMPAPNGSTSSFSLTYTGDTKGWHSRLFGEKPALTEASSGIQTKPGEVVHVAGVRDKAEVRTYVNGRLAATQPLRGEQEYSQVAVKINLGSRFNGRVLATRISKGPRYTSAFEPEKRLQGDDQTLALYHFDKGEGDVLNDSSGNNHHGKIVGAKWVKVDRETLDDSDPRETLIGERQVPNYEIELESEKSSIELPTLLRNRAGKFTIEAWVTSLNGHNTPVIRIGGDYPFSLNRHDKQGIGARVGKGIEVRPGHGALGYEPSKPIHVAVVVDGEMISLYREGKRIVHKAHRGDTESIAAAHAASWLGGRKFAGRLDEVRISTIPRYDADFTPAARHEPDQHTLALYHCDEGNDDILKDSSGNNHHGKIVGAKWVKVRPSENEVSADTITEADGWIDLLPLIDPAKDTQLDDNFSDGAKAENGQLVLGHRTSLALPIKMNGSYQLRGEFTTWNGPKFLVLTCPIANSQPLLMLADGDNESGYQGAGLQSVDGRAARDPENPTHVKERVLIPDQKQTLDLTVRSEGEQVTVKAIVDGKPMVDWTGPAKSLPAMKDDVSRQLVVSTYKGMLKFHSLELKMLDGKAKLLGTSEVEKPASR